MSSGEILDAYFATKYAYFMLPIVLQIDPSLVLIVENSIDKYYVHSMIS